MEKTVGILVVVLALLAGGCSACEQTCNTSGATAGCVESCNSSIASASDDGCEAEAVAAVDCLETIERPVDVEACDADPEVMALAECRARSADARERCSVERDAWRVCSLDAENPWCTPEETASTRAACLDCYGYEHPDCT